MSKPSEFYVGVLDLFAVLLPGAIAAAILEPRFGDLVLGGVIATPQGEAAKWAIFFAFSYFIGHLIFLAGSYVDALYNELRERLNPYGNESAYQCAMRIRDSLIDKSEQKALNTFQWTRSVLIAKCPAAAEDVHRLEADSKFFRSLLVVSALAAIVFFTDGKAIQGIVALIVVVPCFARYYERRLKSTTQAYVHLVTLHRLGSLSAARTADGV
jgi:hypothetical protein